MGHCTHTSGNVPTPRAHLACILCRRFLRRRNGTASNIAFFPRSKYTFCARNIHFVHEIYKMYTFSPIYISISDGGRMRTLRHFTVLCVLIFRVPLRHNTFKKRMCAPTVKLKINSLLHIVYVMFLFLSVPFRRHVLSRSSPL
jgi:hypothetical protein